MVVVVLVLFIVLVSHTHTHTHCTGTGDHGAGEGSFFIREGCGFAQQTLAVPFPTKLDEQAWCDTVVGGVYERS